MKLNNWPLRKIFFALSDVISCVNECEIIIITKFAYPVSLEL
jgi:hypothetical protein